MSALHSLLHLGKCPASRLTPSLFLVYLRIFETATAPEASVSPGAQLCLSDAAWAPIKGQARVRHHTLSTESLR